MDQNWVSTQNIALIKNITLYDNILDFRILKWRRLLWLLYLNDCQARTLPQAPVTGFTGLLVSPTRMTLYLPDPMTYLADEWTGQPQVEHKVTTLNRETTGWPHCLQCSSIDSTFCIDSTGQPPWQLDQYWPGPDDCFLVPDRWGVVPAAADAVAAVVLWCDRILMAPQLRHYTSSSPPRHIMMADTPCRLDPYISCPFPWYSLY